MRLDDRLALAASLYESCLVGADIGTDHAYLPAELLKRGTCERMLLCDVSPGSLRNAAETVERFHLEERTRLIFGDGIAALDEPCGCISVTGMGGETMAGILTGGRAKLNGAVLVLSAHTELPMVRRAVMEIGYHFTAERICEAAGRMYLVWRAEPGEQPLTDAEIRWGSLLFNEEKPLLDRYLRRRLEITQYRLRGLQGSTAADPSALREAEEDVTFYTAKLREVLEP